MTVEELLLYLSLPPSSSPASPSRHLSPDDGQLCYFTQEVEMNQEMRLDTSSGFFVTHVAHFAHLLILQGWTYDVVFVLLAIITFGK